jgi:hypothetical protein
VATDSGSLATLQSLLHAVRLVDRRESDTIRESKETDKKHLQTDTCKQEHRRPQAPSRMSIINRRPSLSVKDNPNMTEIDDSESDHDEYDAHGHLAVPRGVRSQSPDRARGITVKRPQPAGSQSLIHGQSIVIPGSPSLHAAV